MTFPLPSLCQAQKGQTNRPKPIRSCLGVPLIKGHPMTRGVALLSVPTRDIAQLKMLKQPLLVAAGNDTLALRIQL